MSISKDICFTVIGGANVDLMNFSRDKMVHEDSNPGHMEIHPGGVARNVAENLVRLGFNVNFISAFGKDIFGNFLLKSCGEMGIRTADSFISESFNTSTYSALIDYDGNLYAAVSGMDIVEHIPICHMRKALSAIGTGHIIIDANLTEEILKIITENLNGRRIYADAVSTTKALRFKDFFEHIYLLKLNEIEASHLSGVEINGEDGLSKACEYFMDKGVKKIIITSGEKGLFYADDMRSSIYRQKAVKPVNATGAGDAFLAAFAAADTLGKPTEYAINFAQTCARLTLLSKEIVYPQLSFDVVEKEMKLT
ncbi:MAG: carbohydrate kinase family protein [Clostridiales bacterium]|jgi:pseudouridine kinase|nr:carbohydrate kinase family protein [Clostridiales bacterium]